MSERTADLDLIILDLINSRAVHGDEMFVFSSGNLRGSLVSITYMESCLPSATYLKSGFDLEMQMEPCVQLTYRPRPRGHDNIKDPLKFKSTRKPVLFNMPARLVPDALFLQKIQPGVWMINITTTVK